MSDNAEEGGCEKMAYLSSIDSNHTLGVTRLRCTHVLLKRDVPTERNLKTKHKM